MSATSIREANRLQREAEIRRIVREEIFEAASELANAAVFRTLHPEFGAAWASPGGPRADEAEQKAWEQFAHGDCFPHPLIRRPPFGGLRTNPGADTTAAVQSRNGSGRFSLTPFHGGDSGER